MQHCIKVADSLCMVLWNFQTQRLCKCWQDIKISTCEVLYLVWIVIRLVLAKLFPVEASTQVSGKTSDDLQREDVGLFVCRVFFSFLSFIFFFFFWQLNHVNCWHELSEKFFFETWRLTSIFKLGVKAEIKLNVEAWIYYKFVAVGFFIILSTLCIDGMETVLSKVKN